MLQEMKDCHCLTAKHFLQLKGVHYCDKMLHFPVGLTEYMVQRIFRMSHSDC